MEKDSGRETWGRKIEFLLSCIGLAVGLGNIWRFPYLCYKNGGGAFFIPYLIFLIGGGIPIFFLEIALGQFMGEGGISAWKICPLFTGVGYGTIVVVSLLNVYYIVVLAWALVYMGYSFSSTLPWATCENAWNSANCYTPSVGNASSELVVEDFGPGSARIDPAVEFWENKILQMSPSLNEIGGIRWELALALIICWVICYLCVWKGIKSSGKIVYFTSTFPYVMLTALLVRGVTLPGAVNGIAYYLTPDFSKLADSQVWMDAGTQIFFSYAVALGSTIALGSYNNYHHNCYRDCILLSVINSGTSVFSGFVIFSVLGFMSHELNVPISEVVRSGPGLIFIAYPKAVAQMPGAPFWAVAFFFMIMLVGLDSQFIQTEGMITAIVDLFPAFFRQKWRREKFTALVCILTCSIGLLLVTNGGIYIFQLFDYYSASGITLLWFCFFESIAIAWVYGADKFYENLTDMTGIKLNPWLKICWRYITPLICAGLCLFSFISYKPITHNRDEYPPWAEYFGWCLALSSIMCVPLYSGYILLKAKGNLIERFKATTIPILSLELHSRDINLDSLG